jgi:signal transduction histidine kinase
MLTNEKMLRQSICALVDNAIKNTTRGQIAVKTATEGQRLRIVVEDTGCGVPEEAAEHIFERFVKLDEFKEGVGLGLPLCRVFIERLEGSVKLDTSFKEGARFVIDLPL